MRKAVLCVCTFAPFLCQAQAFNEVRYERQYKTVGIVRTKPGTPVEGKDTVRQVDTVFVYAKLPLGKMEKASFRPEMGEVSVPLDRLVITSPYGMRFHPVRKRWAFHDGVDFGAFRDTVRSVLDGVVRSSGYDGGLGHFVRVGHGNHVLAYGHLSQYFHLPGERVKAGEPLGITGSTGLSTGEHLHFSVHRDGRPVDPMDFLAKLAKLRKTLTDNKMEIDNVKQSAVEKMKQAAEREEQNQWVELTREEDEFGHSIKFKR